MILSHAVLADGVFFSTHASASSGGYTPLPMSQRSMSDDLDLLNSEALAELSAIADAAALESWRIKYLGTNGSLKKITPRLKEVPKEDKPRVGALLNQVKTALEAAFAERKSALGSIASSSSTVGIDLTEPGLPLGLGRRHVLSRTIDEITDVFARMGFSVATGPEVEDEWHNFTALNIPADHPARDAADNFYMGSALGLLLRSQTSTVQIRAMSAAKPPLKVIAVGRVYR
ncbi:MAG TPA: hypothetical protein VG711_10740, partial [Phycisphaerales bacterium]|nr:hypothetical protein [Phycisphaerales bacterium]